MPYKESDKMKKAFLVKGAVEVTFYGDYCAEDIAAALLKQAVDNMDDEAFSNIEIQELTELNVSDGQYEGEMFSINEKGKISSDISPAEYFERARCSSDIRAALEDLGWDLDEDFDEDLFEILDNQGYIT
jgi:hypothetical protein